MIRLYSYWRSSAAYRVRIALNLKGLDYNDGDMTLNIAIRTLMVQNGIADYWAGGGLVADSVGEKEYQETLDKIGALRRAVDLPPGRSEERFSRNAETESLSRMRSSA